MHPAISLIPNETQWRIPVIRDPLPYQPRQYILVYYMRCFVRGHFLGSFVQKTLSQLFVYHYIISFTLFFVLISSGNFTYTT